MARKIRRDGEQSPKRSQRAVVNFADPVFAAFREFAEVAYPELALSHALRELALAGMGQDPLDAARSNARRAAFLATRLRAERAVATIFANLAKEFAESAEAAQQELATMAG